VGGGSDALDLYDGLDTFSPRSRPVVLSIGNFDGVHAGHQQILHRLLDAARRHDADSMVMVFKPHPLELLRPEAAPPQLTPLERKLKLLAELGVDACLVCHTDRALLSTTAEDFFHHLIHGRLRPVGLVEGWNFRFGQGRQGDLQVLERLASAVGMFLEVVSSHRLTGGPVSSSRIRELLIEGRVEEAALMLTRPHRISGHVVVGNRRGRALGFPTANVEGIAEIMPGQGIYAVKGHLGGSTWAGALHLGPRPTFRNVHPVVEVHLIGFEGGDLYAQSLAIDFLARIRDVRRFESADALRRQLVDDVNQAARIAEAD
jgi:riboflavin kinase/FMN adenylyltransferase